MDRIDIHIEVPAVKYRDLDASGNRMLELVTDRLGFSARTYTRILIRYLSRSNKTLNQYASPLRGDGAMKVRSISQLLDRLKSSSAK